MIDREQLTSAFETAKSLLLGECQNEPDELPHWEGELSTSALSTATAVMALQQVRNAERSAADYSLEADFDALIQGGLDWLANHQNEDGGWGDTVKSISNISTTMLTHAVFHATGTASEFADQVDKAKAYIDEKGGVPAVVARYGKDKTFSVPILTHCALAGLVDWKEVTSLPFELACLPARFYSTIRLPVVSYALPALIAIGQVKHHHRPSWNPIVRFIRNRAINKSLKVLDRIQPPNGGFLEAAPLTSFVTMSLAGKGLADHVVVKRAVGFLCESVRSDGSWPIDTNLATWVTTLSINALKDHVPDELRPGLSEWLLNQQYKEVHPFTNAAPGGWAWTNLPGGVPDADDTPGAMLAISELSRLMVKSPERLPGQETRSVSEGSSPTESGNLDPSLTRFEVAHSSRVAATADSRGCKPTETDSLEHVSREAAAEKMIAVAASRLSGLCDFFCGLMPAAMRCRRFATQNCATSKLTRRVTSACHGEPDQPGCKHSVASGVEWLLNLQNRDGGFPTFCRGWGTLPFDRSSADITAHCLRALCIDFEMPFPVGPNARKWIDASTKVRRGYSSIKLAVSMAGEEPDGEAIIRYAAVLRGLLFLNKQQRSNGSWVPLWFGNQFAKNDENPVYGTSRVLMAYRDLGLLDAPEAQKAAAWLASVQEPEKENPSTLDSQLSPPRGWGGDAGIAPSVEETALAAEVLLEFEPYRKNAFDGIRWLIDRVVDGSVSVPTPIGFYFARLWYFERLYPLIFAVSALRRAVEISEESPA